MWMLLEEMGDPPTSELSYGELTRIRDARNALRADERVLARKERFYDLLEESLGRLQPPPFIPPIAEAVSSKSAILQISDLHYGIKVNNAWNQYDTEIARERLMAVADGVIRAFNLHDFRELHVVLQGDLISGKIHTTLRLQNQLNVVEQITGVTEILYEMFVRLLAAGIPSIVVHSVAGNHERMTDKKEDNLEEETYTSLINSILRPMLESQGVEFANENHYGMDIDAFTANGLYVVAVHGDKDQFSSLYYNLAALLLRKPDIILTAHRHELRVAEEKGCTMIANGSLVGSDDYAKNLRYISKPLQNLIIVNDDTSFSLLPLLAEPKGGEAN